MGDEVFSLSSKSPADEQGIFFLARYTQSDFVCAILNEGDEFASDKHPNPFETSNR